MKITLRNVPKLEGESTMSLFREAAEWYANKLMGPRLARKLEVRVKFEDTMEEDRNEGGTCIWEDDNVRPREFTIELAKGDLEFMLVNLAHEMVHVKQFAKGELKDVMRQVSMCKYLGKIYDVDKVDYWDLPWEIEAHGRERGLYVRFTEAAGIA